MSALLSRQGWQQCAQTACSAIWESGVSSMALSAGLFSISSLLVKLTGGRVPTFQIVAFRSSLSFLMCALGAHQARIKPLFGKRANLAFLLGRGMFGATAMTSYYLSIQALPLADAVTLFFLNPAVTAVAAWLLLHEPLGWVGVAGVLTSVTGLVILSQPPFLFNTGDLGWDHRRIVGTSFGVISALCAAGAFICIRFIGKREPALVMSVYFHTTAFVTSVIPLAIGVPSHAVWPSGVDILLLFGIAAMSFWGQILVGRAFQLLTAAKGSAINFTQVLYSYIFGIALLHETLSLWGVLGSLLITGGVLMVNLRPQGKAASAQPDASAGTQQGQELAEVQVERSNRGKQADEVDNHEMQPLLASHQSQSASGDGQAAGVLAVVEVHDDEGAHEEGAWLLERHQTSDAAQGPGQPPGHGHEQSPGIRLGLHRVETADHATDKAPLLLNTEHVGVSDGGGADRVSLKRSGQGTQGSGLHLTHSQSDMGVPGFSHSHRASPGNSSGSTAGAGSQGSESVASGRAGHHSSVAECGQVSPQAYQDPSLGLQGQDLSGARTLGDGVYTVSDGGLRGHGSVSGAQDGVRHPWQSLTSATGDATISAGHRPHFTDTYSTHQGHTLHSTLDSSQLMRHPLPFHNPSQAPSPVAQASDTQDPATPTQHQRLAVTPPRVAVEPFLVSPGGRAGSVGEILASPGARSGRRGAWHALARVLGHMDSRLAAHGLGHAHSIPSPRDPDKQ